MKRKITKRKHPRKKTLAGKKKGGNCFRGGHGGFVTCLCWVSIKMLKAKWIGMDGPQYHQLTDNN